MRINKVFHQRKGADSNINVDDTTVESHVVSLQGRWEAREAHLAQSPRVLADPSRSIPPGSGKGIPAEASQKIPQVSWKMMSHFLLKDTANYGHGIFHVSFQEIYMFLCKHCLFCSFLMLWQT